MTESYKRLYERLGDSEFECIPAGFHETQDIYELVRKEYPELCDDTTLCREVCGTENNQPEWKHRVRTVQQDLLRDPDSRVEKLSQGWYYEPTAVDVTQVPDEEPRFEVGAYYNRWELHDRFGGQRYSGIATPADYPVVFLFTGDSGEEYGYEDEFLEDDSFLYAGEGTEGDMEMEGGNKAISDHHREGEDLHLFEDTDHPWIVSYIGQFEYNSHRWETLSDKQDNQREAIRFHLVPVGGTEVEIENGGPASLSDDELFRKAKQSSPRKKSDSTSGSSSSGGRTYHGSDVVKEFALRDADGVCQGCGEEAPFLDGSGNPFLEVHHLHRRSDGGPDDPENVIALCPNCHRRVHYGQDGEEFNQQLMTVAEERNRQYH